MGSSEGPHTCIGLEVLRGHHDYKPDGPLISEHIVGPPADGAHALHSGNAVVGNEHLDGKKEEGTRAAHLPMLEAAYHPESSSRLQSLLWYLDHVILLCISIAHSPAQSRCSKSSSCMDAWMDRCSGGR